MHDEPTTNNQTFTGFSSFRVNNGRPNQISLTLGQARATLMRPDSIYAQDQWTHSRLTLQGGVRYDHVSTTFTGGDRADAPTILPPVTAPLGFITSPIVINDAGFAPVSAAPASPVRCKSSGRISALGSTTTATYAQGLGLIRKDFEYPLFDGLGSERIVTDPSTQNVSGTVATTAL